MILQPKSGMEIYELKKRRFIEKGRNTEDWNEDKKGSYFRRIISHFGGTFIPYSCFEHRKKLSIKLFDNDNDWNYVYFPIFMAVYLGLLAERRDGLKFISE